jgi:Leucine-rich repeat (LRR) protein
MIVLGIAQVGLQEVTSDVSKLVNLKELSLFTNRAVQHLPESISCLQKLEDLNIRGRSISELPVGLGSLASLADLKARGYDDLEGLRFPASVQVNVATQ